MLNTALNPQFDYFAKNSGKLKVLSLGLTHFASTWKTQLESQKALIDGHGEDTLILCQHHPVITAGRTSKSDSVRISPGELAKRGVEFVHIERGGDVTYHGPGQLVAYPILDLRRKRQDVHWYMRTLEEVIIRTLSTFGLPSFRVSGMTGVWTLSPRKDYTLPSSEHGASQAKIASLGVRISRWCTLHGISINLANCQYGFSMIDPCGMRGISVTSLEEHGRSFDYEGVTRTFLAHFQELFGFESR